MSLIIKWLRRYQLYLILCFLLVGTAFLSYAVAGTMFAGNDKEALTADAENGLEEPLEEPTEEPAFSYYCPLDGRGLQEEPQVRPLAVIIDNDLPARPQVGLKEADVIMEMPVEGGLTRFLAVYYCQNVERLGPVRSARPYFAQSAQDFEAVLVHIGGSPQAKSFIERNNIANLDEFGITRGFWRESARRSPHNLYSSTAGLHNLVKDYRLYRQVTPKGYTFLEEEAELQGEKAENVEIYYPHKSFQVKYDYDSKTGLYLRYTGGFTHLDDRSKNQLSTPNIVVQYVSARVIDGEGRLDIDMVGSGEALVFTRGTAVEASWQKNSLHSPTIFRDNNDNEIGLSSGQVWIQVVRQGTDVKFW